VGEGESAPQAPAAQAGDGQTPQDPDTQGGKGGRTALTPNDARLIGRAIRGRWPVPQERRAELIDLLIAVVASKDARAGRRIAAFRALLAANAQNMEVEQRGKTAQQPPDR
jgi:hypothetical protein